MVIILWQEAFFYLTIEILIKATLVASCFGFWFKFPFWKFFIKCRKSLRSEREAYIDNIYARIEAERKNNVL